MKSIGVLGAGVIGVSTAFALARLGHQVTVFDKNTEVAGGASHANGAQLSYSYVEPFANPTTLRALPKYILGQDPAVQLGLSLSPRFLSWGLRFLGNCLPFRAKQNLKSRAELAKQSEKALQDFIRDMPDFPKASSQGKLVLLSRNKDVRTAENAGSRFAALGLEHTVLSTQECLEIEPALASIRDPFKGAIYAKSDFAIDPVQYCLALLRSANDMGVSFRFGEPVNHLITGQDAVKGISTQEGEIPFDAVIVCLGNDAPGFLKASGISVPIFPMRGYSLTFNSTKAAPAASVTSLRHKMVFANLGDQMRIAGFSDANLKESEVARRQDELLSLSRQFWPDIADFEGPHSRWSHFRPMVPSGVPMIGMSRIKNLYLNIGHGSLGYTFAAGSAMRIAGEIGQALENPIAVPGGYKHAVS